jgi:chromosome segregation ATPase
MVADNLNERVSRLEESENRAWTAIEALAEKQARLDDALVTLADAQIKTEQRFRETDARIEKLVVAIGEFLRNGRQN